MTREEVKQRRKQEKMEKEENEREGLTERLTRGRLR